MVLKPLSLLLARFCPFGAIARSITRTKHLTRFGDGEVAIWWDYENCPVPSKGSTSSIVRALKRVAKEHGRTIVFNAYAEVAVTLKATSQKSLLDMGVCVKNCPHLGKKEVVDKRMMTDMWAHAFDRRSARAELAAMRSITFIVVTGDRDFFHTIISLGMRGVRVILISTSSNEHYATLLSVCPNVSQLSWDRIIGAQAKSTSNALPLNDGVRHLPPPNSKQASPSSGVAASNHDPVPCSKVQNNSQTQAKKNGPPSNSQAKGKAGT